MKKTAIMKAISFVLVISTLLSLFTVYVGATGDGQSVADTGGVVSDLPSDIFTELEGEETAVTTAQELEDAIAGGASVIRIMADFELDRTFYVTHDVAIYSAEVRTLTRASDFGGDIFLVGEYQDGTLTESEVTLTVGNPASEANNLLIIDGNKANMSATVVGSVFFVTEQGIVDVFGNATLKNHKKTGNERTLTEKYGVSYPIRVGGAVATVANKAEMNI